LFDVFKEIVIDLQGFAINRLIVAKIFNFYDKRGGTLGSCIQTQPCWVSSLKAANNFIELPNGLLSGKMRAGASSFSDAATC